MEAPRKFLESLVERGLITPAEGKDLLYKYQADCLGMLQHLVQREAGHRHELGQLWGDAWGLAYVDLASTTMRYDLVGLLPERFAKTHGILPLYQVGGVITLAVSLPPDPPLLSEIENIFNTFVSPVFAFPDQIQSALELAYQSHSTLEAMLAESTFAQISSHRTLDAEELRKLSEEEAIVRFARGLLLLAVKRRASDVHIEPLIRSVRIRFRVDGVLQEVFTLDPALLPAIASRFKVMADANISETRRPQEGRILLEVLDRPIDFRLSIVPTMFGEKIALRVLGYSAFQGVPDLAELDFSAPVFDQIKQTLQSPHGVFFLTGPTGSGKTTTLYSILKYFNHPGIHIITIENPVEYTLEGINQVQVNEAVDLTFASALRFFLRQDPDVILVGEVRDVETARIACSAALTGHLVLTTLHTNNAIQSLPRLVDLGVEPYLVSPAVIGAMAQRLVRRLCSSCREEYQLPAADIERLFLTDGTTPVRFFRSKGCEKCNFTGYLGRLAIHEIFLVREDMRRLIARGADYAELRRAAEQAGYKPLRYDGLKKVLRGMTSIEEIDRICNED